MLRNISLCGAEMTNLDKNSTPHKLANSMAIRGLLHPCKSLPSTLANTITRNAKVYGNRHEKDDGMQLRRKTHMERGLWET